MAIIRGEGAGYVPYNHHLWNYRLSIQNALNGLSLVERIHNTFHFHLANVIIWSLNRVKMNYKITVACVRCRLSGSYADLDSGVPPFPCSIYQLVHPAVIGYFENLYCFSLKSYFSFFFFACLRTPE